MSETITPDEYQSAASLIAALEDEVAVFYRALALACATVEEYQDAATDAGNLGPIDGWPDAESYKERWLAAAREEEKG